MTCNKTSAGFTLVEVMVALSVLAIGIAGVAKLTQAAYTHLAVTEQYQQAAYNAYSHLNSLSVASALSAGKQMGRYPGIGAQPGFRWELLLVPLAADAFLPTSISLSDKVNALQASLIVWIDDDTRSIDFHTLILARPLEQ